MTALLALLLLQAQEDPKSLDERIRGLEVDVTILDLKIDRAIQAQQHEEAARLFAESREKRAELEKLRDERHRREFSDLGPRTFSWELRLEWIDFDPSLGLERDSGVGLRGWLFEGISFDLRRWDANDLVTGGDAEILELGIGMTSRHRVLLMGEKSEVAWSTSLGSAILDSENGDHETAFAAVFDLSVRGGRGAIRVELGASLHLWRTDFNRDDEDWQASAALHAGVNVGF